MRKSNWIIFAGIGVNIKNKLKPPPSKDQKNNYKLYKPAYTRMFFG